MLLLGNVAQKTALGKGCRAESVWNMRRRQAGPEGVVGGGGGSLAFVSQRGALWRLGASEGGTKCRGQPFLKQVGDPRLALGICWKET